MGPTMTHSQNNVGEQEPISRLVSRLRTHFESGRTRPLTFRDRQLEGLASFFQECEREIEEALHSDLGRPALEAFTADIALVSSEIARTRKHLRQWIKPECVSTGLSAQPG